MGLLDLFNSPEGQQALGLLAAGGPQTDPSKTGFGQRLAAASGFADQWKQRQADAEMEKQKMAINAMLMQKHQMDLDSAKQSFADQAKMRDLVSQYRTPATPAMPGGLSADAAGALPPEMQTGSTVKPMAARPSGFDREGYGAALEGINPEMGLSYLQKIQKDEAPIKLSPGEQLFSGQRGGYKPLLSVPAKPESKPSALQEYEYSRSQGYNGTFDQWDTARKRAGATSVNVTNLADNLGLKPKDRFEMEGKLRADYESQTKADSEIANTAQDIAHILKQPGALKDQAAIYKFAKSLDPQGAVREADYAAIVKTAGGLDYVTNIINKAMTGEQLNPKQRAEMANVASALAEVGKKRIAKIQQRTAANAKMYNLNPENLFSPNENQGWGIVR